MNHNQILGVAPNASRGEIQAAFRKSALETHPDHSNSPEAAEAFARIKEARDELMKRAEAAETATDATSIQHSTAAAVRATTASAYSQPIDIFDGFTPEEIAAIQQLDALAYRKPKQSLFKRSTESLEVRNHRKKLRTNFQRLDGRY